MRTFPRTAISLLLIAVICTLTLAGTPPYPIETPAPCQPGNQNGKKIQVLKNDAAKLRVKQLLGKSKALKRALKDLERLGKSPDWEKSGVFTEESNNESKGPIAPSRFGASSFAPQEQIYNDGAGSEMVMITASGPEEYWSGVIYTHDATTGLDATYTAVLTGLVMAQLDTMDVIDELYYPPDGSSPIREEPPTPVDTGGGPGGFENPLLELPVAKNNLKSTPSVSVGMINAAFSKGTATAPRAGIIGWFKRYFRCVKRCQALTTLTCFNTFAVPRPGMPYPNYQGFFVCLGFGALASSIVCAFNTHSCGG
jgi:hypothetical protein